MWGYVSSTIGDEITRRVRTGKRVAHLPGFGAGNSSVLAGLGLLRSYRGMGAAAVACSHGCSCAPQAFQLQHQPRVGRRTRWLRAWSMQLLA